MKYFTLFILFISIHLTSLAFSCTPLPIEVEIEDYEFVFLGEITDLHSTKTFNRIMLYNYRNWLKLNPGNKSMKFSDYKDAFSSNTLFYPVEICNQYKGNILNDTIYIQTNMFDIGWRRDLLETNNNVLFYCNQSKMKYRTQILTFNTCSRTNLIKYAENDITYLEQYYLENKNL